ncbi:hypothetical protein BC833DRAFT_525018 [Globomyces pollinis-pini]|nr:hypothetical protein BC833DRAFT_525018 [Globomyces pollinis-pini]
MAGKAPKPDSKFWVTQPVPKTDEVITENGPIEENKSLQDIKQTPYNLPSTFEWYAVDLNDESDLKDVYKLLTENYVEDDNAVFRFDYSPEFLKWYGNKIDDDRALQPPGWKRDWHLGVRVAENKKLVGFIGGIPIDMKIYDLHDNIAEINFLCVHKKLRSKRLAPVLIKEVTRRINLTGIFQAVYTAGVYLPKPVSTCKYYHRCLQPKKLIEVGFSYLPSDMTMAGIIKKYKLPAETELPIVPMEEADVPGVTVLLAEYFKNFDFTAALSEADVRHWLLPIDNVIYSYVVKDEDGTITDFVSFYNLPSSVSGHAVHKNVKAAYLFYYATQDDERLTSLVNDALIKARNNKFDVFNCLTLANNSQFLDELKFGAGDGNLHYYVYNYRCKDVPCDKMGLVML